MVMATGCAIGLQEKDGVMTTFCICDGYLDVAGFRLYHWYSDREKLGWLIRLGALESIGESVEFVTKLAYDGVMENQRLRGIIGVPEMMLDSEGKKKTVIDNYRREVKKFSSKGGVLGLQANLKCGILVPA